MANINELVLEALMNATSDPSTSGTTADSKSTTEKTKTSSSSLSPSGSKIGNPTINTKTDSNMTNRFQTKYPTLNNFIGKKKPQYGLGSGKSLMGW